MKRRPLRLVSCAALALPALLGACDAIYDDTKGWANRLEASILETAHDMSEPDPAAEPVDTPAPAVAGRTAPPAVPVEPVATLALAPAEPATATAEAKRAAAPAASIPITEPAKVGAVADASAALVGGGGEETPARSADEPGSPAKPQPASSQAAEAKAADAKTAVPLPKSRPESKPQTPAEAAPLTADTSGEAVAALVLHLSSLRSEEAAKREWHDLQQSFPEPLGQMQAQFHRAELGEKGTFYRVLAGPLPSRSEAAQVCAALKAKNAKQYCRIVPADPKA
jgi:SPOR domain